MENYARCITCKTEKPAVDFMHHRTGKKTMKCKACRDIVMAYYQPRERLIGITKENRLKMLGLIIYNIDAKLINDVIDLEKDPLMHAAYTKILLKIRTKHDMEEVDEATIVCDTDDS